MSQALGYPSPRRHPAIVTDRWGRTTTTLANDGTTFTLTLRGNRYTGMSPDSLELVGPPADTDQPPTLHHGDLWNFAIEWRMSILTDTPDGAPAPTPLSIRLTLGDPTADTVVNHIGATVALHLPTGDIATTTPRELLEDALADLRTLLPDGTGLRACISCAFSDYSPAGSMFIGSMACFRDHKAAYRTVTGKPELFAVWDRRSGFVQETFDCDEFEQRPPGTGYRG